MKKDTVYINRETIVKLGIDPNDAVAYLENKNALDMNPTHIKCLLLLKRQNAVSSS